MRLRVEWMNRSDKWKKIGPEHSSEEEANTWIEANRKESWMNVRLKEVQPWSSHRTSLLRDEELAWKVEALDGNRWEQVGQLHDLEEDAIAWGEANRCDWWSDWQVIPVQPDDRIRFSRKWLPEPNTGCWLWMGAESNGYGMFELEGFHVRASRASWVLHRGKIPDALIIRHKCDTPLCVNPDHLIPGTYLDNFKDMVARGRENLRGRAKPNAQGEKHNRAVLTVDEVISIRNAAANRTHTFRQLAEKYQVSIPNIQAIVYRKTWKHI